MKTIKILALLMAFCMIAACLIGCDASLSENGEGAADNDQTAQNQEVYTMGTIRADIGKYTVVRPELADALRDAAVLLCETAEIKTGVRPKIVTDYEDEASEGAPEILIGNTTRAESTAAKQQMTDRMNYFITQIGNKICIVGNTNEDVADGVNEFLSVYFGYSAPGKLNFHNVTDYGAKGDGQKDDTVAFAQAIKAAEKDGLPVYVPAGKYRITETMELNSVTLYGYDSGAWTADNSDLPVIYHSNLEEPLFDVISGSISGLHIMVQGVKAAIDNADDDIEMVETIRLQQAGARASNLKINNPYIGISTYYNPSESGNPGRCFIENIFIIQAWDTGVYVHGTYDVATLCNIEVWNNDMSNSCPTAFRFGKNDDIRCVNLFTFNAGTGFLFEESIAGSDGSKGGCWGSFTNCSVDYTSVGVLVGAGSHHLTFVGGTYWGHHHGLKVNSNTAKDTLVTFTGCEIKTNGASPIDIAGGWMVTVSGCNLVRVMEGHSSIPINITGGQAVTITGNSIATQGTAVNISSTFQGAANVTGNTVLTSATTEKNVITVSGSKSVVNTTGNVILTGQKFE